MIVELPAPPTKFSSPAPPCTNASLVAAEKDVNQSLPQ